MVKIYEILQTQFTQQQKAAEIAHCADKLYKCIDTQCLVTK